MGEGKSRLEKAEEELPELEDEFGKITHSATPENATWEMWTRGEVETEVTCNTGLIRILEEKKKERSNGAEIIFKGRCL